MRINPQQRGAILLSTLLFIMLLTLLALYISQTSWLESKMSNAYVAKLIALYEAENSLYKYEQKLLAGEKINEKIAQKLDGYSYCSGVEFYRLHVTSVDGTTELQSTVAKVGDISKCEPKPRVISGRQSFRTIF
jgi:hypothetical protein